MAATVLLTRGEQGSHDPGAVQQSRQTEIARQLRLQHNSSQADQRSTRDQYQPQSTPQRPLEQHSQPQQTGNVPRQMLNRPVNQVRGPQTPQLSAGQRVEVQRQRVGKTRQGGDGERRRRHRQGPPGEDDRQSHLPFRLRRSQARTP